MLLWKQEFLWLLDEVKRKKKEDGEYAFFKALAKRQKVAHGWPSITWTSWKGNDMLYYCYVIKNRLDIQFVKQILLEMVIGQQMKREGYDQN